MKHDIDVYQPQPDTENMQTHIDTFITRNKSNVDLTSMGGDTSDYFSSLIHGDVRTMYTEDTTEYYLSMSGFPVAWFDTELSIGYIMDAFRN